MFFFLGLKQIPTHAYDGTIFVETKPKTRIMLLRIIALLSLILSLNLNAQQIDWISLNEAEKRMQKEPRKVLVDVYTSWCGPCKMMEQNTFKNPQIVEYINKNYYAVKFNAESPDELTFRGTTYKNEGYDPNKTGRNSTHDLARAIAPVSGRIAYPTVVYMDENFKILAPVQGYHTPQQIEPILKYIAESDYTSTSFDDFKKGFQNTIK